MFSSPQRSKIISYGYDSTQKAYRPIFVSPTGALNVVVTSGEVQQKIQVGDTSAVAYADTTGNFAVDVATLNSSASTTVSSSAFYSYNARNMMFALRVNAITAPGNVILTVKGYATSGNTALQTLASASTAMTSSSTICLLTISPTMATVANQVLNAPIMPLYTVEAIWSGGGTLGGAFVAIYN